MNGQIETLRTPAGLLFIRATDNGITAISWSGPPYEGNTPSDKTQAHIAHATQQLNDYFNGKRRDFDLPLISTGTEFQKKVWNALKAIPYGQTVSYSDIAQKVGSPNAVRAVGTANSKNPHSIVVPCHRVIAKSGTLAGYAGGKKTKHYLLQLEKKAV